MPGWMRTIDHFTPAARRRRRSALSAVNPKNLVLTVGAAAAIAQTGDGRPSRRSRSPCSS